MVVNYSSGIVMKIMEMRLYDFEFIRLNKS